MERVRNKIKSKIKGMNTKKIVFFQARTQYENTGDVLINKSLLDHLKRYATLLVNDSDMPEWYVDELGVEETEKITETGGSFNRFMLKSAISRFFNRDKPRVYLIAGPPGHQFGNSLGKAARDTFSGIIFFGLQLLGVKIIKIGFSIGPIGKKVEFSEKFRSVFTNFYYVRDTLSLALVKSIGIKKAKLFPDLAWSYKSLPINSSLSIVDKRKLLFTFRGNIVTGHEDSAYLKKLVDFVGAVLMKYHLQYECIICYQVEMDRDFCLKIYEELCTKYNVQFIDGQIKLDTAPNLYRDSVAILTNRLHGALLAYKYGALPIIVTDVEKHIKIKGIYEDAGIGGLMIDTEDRLSSMLGSLESAISNKSMLMESIKEAEERYISVSNRLISEIFNDK